MEIVWLGHSCFRLRGREASIVTDPCPPSTGYSIGRLSADIVTISHQHEDHTYLKAVAGSPVILEWPGEYEIHGAFITGVATHHNRRQEAAHGGNVAFVLEMEEIRVCHLGNLNRTPTADQVEQMSGVDILLVPVGGVTTIDGTAAAEVVSLLEPRLVIPMHYSTEVVSEKLEPPDRFLKEMGVKAVEPQPKLTVSRTSLPHETQVVLLDYRRS